jgi:ABC-type multidrug transport system ATPase subunit
MTDIAIETDNLTKRYGSTLALDSLCLSVAQGEVYGYLGPNGAGKTTTIRPLLGLHRPTIGSAALFGVDAWGDPVRAHRRVAYVAGKPSLWPSLTAEETLDFLANLHGRVDTGYRHELVARFALDTRKKVRALSKGNRQKVQLIAALATRLICCCWTSPLQAWTHSWRWCSVNASRRPRVEVNASSCHRTFSARWKPSATGSASFGRVG